MACTKMQRTSSRLEMMNMEISNNSENFEIDNENNNQNENIFEKIFFSLLLIKNFLLENFNELYGNYLHIYCIIVFEIFFYFNYIVYVEKEEIQKVLKLFASNIEEYFGDYISNIPDSNIDNMKIFCEGLNNKYVNKNNEGLKDSAYNIIWTLSFFLFIMMILHFKIVCDKFKFIKKTFEAIIFICFIAIFEYYFFTEIVKKYNILTQEQASCYLLENIF